MQQVCNNERNNIFLCPPVKQKNHMYDDNFLGGSDSVETIQVFIGELQSLFQTSGFQLKKWVSNEPLATENIPDALKATSLTHHSILIHRSEF